MCVVYGKLVAVQVVVQQDFFGRRSLRAPRVFSSFQYASRSPCNIGRIVKRIVICKLLTGAGNLSVGNMTGGLVRLYCVGEQIYGNTPETKCRNVDEAKDVI